MQSSSTERMRCRKLKDHKAPVSSSKQNKMLRRNRMLYRAIKQGQFIEEQEITND